MPASYSQAKTTFNNAGSLLYTAYATNYPAVNTNAATVNTNYNGDQRDVLTAQIRAARSAMLGLINANGALVNIYSQSIIEMAQAANYPGTDVAGAILWLQQYMDDVGIFAGGAVGEYITPRNIQRGTVTSPTNCTVSRLTVNRWGQAIQTGYAETIRLEVANGTSASSRTVNVYGSDPGQDAPALLQFDQQGSGLTSLNALTAIDPATASDVITNPRLSFGTLADGTAITTQVSGWTLGGTWESDTDNYLLTNTTSLQTSTDASYITQNYRNLQNGTPYLPFCWVYVDSNFVSNNCTVTISWGSKSQAFAGSALTQNAWNLLRVDRDLDLWVNQFDSATAPRLNVSIAIATAGVAKLGMAGLAPMTLVGGTYWAAHVGSTVPLVYATGTVADTLTTASVGKHAFLQAFLYGATMPVTGSSNIDSIS